jgi:prophage regulatory protein
MPAPNNDNQIIVSLNDVCAMSSLSRTAINNHRAAGTFPMAVQLGEKRLGFVKAEVLEWLQQRIDARRAA